MNPTLFALLIFSFVAGTGAVLLLIYGLTRGKVVWSKSGARVIFDTHEEGVGEDPAAHGGEAASPGVEVLATDPRSAEDIAARTLADTSSRKPVMAFFVSSVVWLLIGSTLGLIGSLKLTFPDLLNEEAALTFGRLRPLHLTLVIYGWASMAGIAAALWLMPRLLKTPLRGERYALWGARIWNLGLALGSVALLMGWTDGLEWLEVPWQIDILFVIGGALAAVPVLWTIAKRRVGHLYVSAWYIGAAFVWFPLLFVVANLPGVHGGVEQATTNWWYAHNVLGLWLTPFGLAIAYYFIPKVLGRPIYSYGLSLVGFWSLAIFYSQVGMHHLIGGPVPTWLVAISIVHSVMMVIPVVAVAVNHHWTMRGRFAALRHSPTLRFVVLGAMMYTVTSIEGSVQALRSVNQLTHFTHFTVAHAHLGIYGFVSFTLFGAFYFLLPRLSRREWPRPRLIKLHFWLAFIGIATYVIGMSIGGILQGLAMQDPNQPFTSSTTTTLPWLHARTIGGTLMTLAHLVFAWHAYLLVSKRGPDRATTPWAPAASVSPSEVAP